MRHGLLTRLLKPISLLPLSALYCLTPLIYWLLYSVVQYRKKTVRRNIRAAFPKKTQQSCLQIEKRFYRYLADLLIEIVKGYQMPCAIMSKRFRLLNPEVIEKACKVYGGALLLPPHYGNWEWGIAIGDQLNTPTIGFYKTLHDAKANALFLAARDRFAMQIKPVDKAARILLAHKNTQTGFVLLFDQNPVGTKNTAWMSWLHQPTLINTTPAHLARKFKYPLIYLHIEKVKRGYYTVEAKEVLMTADQSPEAITASYMALLADQINTDPALWLWSHRRWKATPPKDFTEQTHAA